MKLLVVSIILGLQLANCLHVSVKNDDSKKYCIILDGGDAKGTITYENAEKKIVPYQFDIKSTVTGEELGFCMGAEKNVTIERLVVNFYPNDMTPNNTDNPWSLSIDFVQKPEMKDGGYVISTYSLTAIIYDGMFPNVTREERHFTKSNKAELEWKGEQDLGFQCSSSGLSFTDDASVNFSNLKVVAFGAFDADKFPNDQRFNLCQLDIRTSDVVPIVVGACLAGLVIIVLIAYLIGRARAKRQGYASV